MSNRISIYGRLTKTPELTTLKSGKELSTFNVASKSRTKDEEGNYKADFFTCVAFGERAKTICEYCQKGDPVMISGTMEMNTFEKEDGTKTTFWKCIVDDVEFCATKSDREEQQKNDIPKATKQLEMQPIDDPDDLPF